MKAHPKFHDWFTDDHPGLLTLAAVGLSVLSLAIVYLIGS